MAHPKKERRKRGSKGSETQSSEKKTAPWVSWIAILLGVGMTIIGILLLLWGFAWQTGVGETGEIDEGGQVGGPALIPLGAVMATVGIMWLFTGWNRFKGKEGDQELRTCPYCGRRVEADLNFCYFCNRSFQGEDRRGELRGEKKAPPIKEEKL